MDEDGFKGLVRFWFESEMRWADAGFLDWESECEPIRIG